MFGKKYSMKQNYIKSISKPYSLSIRIYQALKFHNYLDPGTTWKVSYLEYFIVCWNLLNILLCQSCPSCTLNILHAYTIIIVEIIFCRKNLRDLLEKCSFLGQRMKCCNNRSRKTVEQSNQDPKRIPNTLTAQVYWFLTRNCRTHKNCMKRSSQSSVELNRYLTKYSLEFI